MTANDGRNATSAYRARVGGNWYWVDPGTQPENLEAGDTVLVYTRDGQAALAVLQSPVGHETEFASLEGEKFMVPRAEIAAIHLAAVDDDQASEG